MDGFGFDAFFSPFLLPDFRYLSNAFGALHHRASSSGFRSLQSENLSGTPGRRGKHLE